MNVGAVIVEELDCSGELRSLQMLAGPEGPITIAHADDFEQPPSGPFHFRQKYYKEKFEKEFAEQTKWKLSKSHFRVEGSDYHFNISWKDIPTERNSLSCYSLSLPQLAVPSRIRFTDPYSDREYSKSVFRDNGRRRFVANLECRSRYGMFAFLLDIKFKLCTEDNFAKAGYTDEHTSKYAPHANPFEYPASANWKQLIQEVFPAKAGVGQIKRPSDISLAKLEKLPRHGPGISRMVYKLYQKLQPEIQQARIAAREEGLTVESIRDRFPILGGAGVDSIRDFILTNSNVTTSGTAAKEIISKHADCTFGTIDRYTRRITRN